MIGGGRPQFDGQLDRPNVCELAGMEPGAKPMLHPGLEYPPCLDRVEGTPIAEDITESGQRRAHGEHLLCHRPEIGVAQILELLWDGMGAEEGRDHVDRKPLADLVGYLEQMQLGQRLQPVTGLDLDCRRPSGEHATRSGYGIFCQRVRSGLAGGGDR